VRLEPGRRTAGGRTHEFSKGLAHFVLLDHLGRVRRRLVQEALRGVGRRVGNQGRRCGSRGERVVRRTWHRPTSTT
jgi:hypothetical protein